MAVPGVNLSQINASKFCFDNFLTPNQQKAFSYLPIDLREIMMTRLLSSQESNDLMTARLILDITTNCLDSEIQRTVDLFFLTIVDPQIEDNDINPFLGKLKKYASSRVGLKVFLNVLQQKK